MSARKTPQRLARLIPAAERYDCSVKTLRRRIIDGTITGYRAGPKILLIDLDEADRKLIRPVTITG